MIPTRGPEVWKHHPYLGLLLCSAVGGGFGYAVIDSLAHGSYRWGRGDGVTIITREHDPLAFWFGTSAFAVAATFVLILGVVKFTRQMRRSKGRAWT